jgi:long-chain acyl-CoA synthetase
VNLAHLLANAARSFPEQPAISLGDRRLYTYAAYGELAARLASGMTGRLGLQAGDRVALAMNNNAEYLAILFAIWRAGLVAVPANAKLHARELAYIAADCGARLCIANADVAGPLADLLPRATRLIVLGETEWRELAATDPGAIADCRPDDLAWIFYTSGTTGRPKGAMLSHRNLMAMTVGYLADIDYLTPADCFIHAAAQSHANRAVRPLAHRQGDTSRPAAEWWLCGGRAGSAAAALRFGYRFCSADRIAAVVARSGLCERTGRAAAHGAARRGAGLRCRLARRL